MKQITRKSMLYKTEVEYGDYTMNHVLGCAHGCRYPCYAQMQKQRYGVVKSYEEWCEPKLVENTLELLDKEIPKLKDKITSVQLCFSTDPFMEGFPEVGEMSIKAIKKLNDAGIKCTVLTKGILPMELVGLSKENEYGITLVTFDEDFREWYEPHTARLQERYNALKALHDKGCKTWISVEPYPTPNILRQRLVDFLCEITPATDKIIFGKMNYNSEVTEFASWKDFYNLSARIVREWCEMNDLEYHIKSGTEVYE